MPRILKLSTNVSKANWCIFNENGVADFEEAKITIGNKQYEPLSWFDKLFENEIVIRDIRSKPLSFLLTGPPGSGKTTLAFEICYRLALQEHSSLYITLDSETDQFIENAKSFDFEDLANHVRKFKDKNYSVDTVTIWGTDNIRSKAWNNLAELVDSALLTIGKWIAKTSEAARHGIKVSIKTQTFKDGTSKVTPDVLVVDSLNIIAKERSAIPFQKILKMVPKNTKIIIFVLDSSSSNGNNRFWEYLCDIVVRLDYTNLRDYYIRTIEIVKARYQAHVWGKHQLKIYPKFELPSKSDPNYSDKLRRSHPYRKEGGIFIYPSIHYYLSAYKRIGQTEPPSLVNTKPIGLNEILRQREKTGLPEGRCTAFIGCRGAHKSHLGYLHILHRLMVTDNETGLFISLRDDEEMTKNTMTRILEQEFQNPLSKKELVKLGKKDLVNLPAKNILDEFEKKNRLEILYFHPGYITPEEFFHRMFISIQRLKKDDKKLTVMFNSVDQLSARFPLCAKEEIFIPAIVKTLSGENVTSIFIAVDEPGQPFRQYGLLPMADLIMSFYPHKFKFDPYYKHLNEVYNFDNNPKRARNRIEKVRDELAESTQFPIVIQVVRFAGGQKAGARGILELVNSEDLIQTLYSKAGLHFTKLSSKYSHGNSYMEECRFPRL